MNLMILSCGHDSRSRSRLLAREAERLLTAQGHRPTFVDLRDVALPTFDAAVLKLPAFEGLHRSIAEVDGVFLAAPIYDRGLGSGTKNLIERHGKGRPRERLVRQGHGVSLLGRAAAQLHGLQGGRAVADARRPNASGIRT